MRQGKLFEVELEASSESEARALVSELCESGGKAVFARCDVSSLEEVTAAVDGAVGGKTDLLSSIRAHLPRRARGGVGEAVGADDMSMALRPDRSVALLPLRRCDQQLSDGPSVPLDQRAC